MNRMAGFIGFLILLLCANTYAQSGDDGQYFTDSLESVIRKTPDDTAKAVMLNKLSDYWSDKDSARAASYVRRSIQLSKGNNYYLAEAHFYLAGAFYYFDAGKSESEYQKVIAILLKDASRRSLSLRSRAWHNIGALKQSTGDDKIYADILLNRAIPLAQMARDTLRVAQNYGEVAMVFQNILNYQKAIVYYQNAIELASDLKPLPFDMLYFRSGLALNYIYNGELSLGKNQLDKAKELLPLRPASGDHANYYMVLGVYYSYSDKLYESLAALDSASLIA